MIKKIIKRISSKTLLFFAVMVLVCSCGENKSQNPLLGKWDYSYFKSEMKLKNDTVFQPLDSAISVFNDSLKSFEFINSNEVTIYGAFIFGGSGLGKYSTWGDNTKTMQILFAGEPLIMGYEIKEDTLILNSTIMYSDGTVTLKNDTNNNIMKMREKISELKTKSYFIRHK
jgi:hypothetical protein